MATWTADEVRRIAKLSRASTDACENDHNALYPDARTATQMLDAYADVLEVIATAKAQLWLATQLIEAASDSNGASLAKLFSSVVAPTPR